MAGTKEGGVICRPVERVPGPFDEAEDNGILLSRQELTDGVEAEPCARRQELQQQSRVAEEQRWKCARSHCYCGREREVRQICRPGNSYGVGYLSSPERALGDGQMKEDEFEHDDSPLTFLD